MSSNPVYYKSTAIDVFFYGLGWMCKMSVVQFVDSSREN